MKVHTSQFTGEVLAVYPDDPLGPSCCLNILDTVIFHYEGGISRLYEVGEQTFVLAKWTFPVLEMFDL